MTVKLEIVYSHDSLWQSKRVIWAYSLQKIVCQFDIQLSYGMLTTESKVLDVGWPWIKMRYRICIMVWLLAISINFAAPTKAKTISVVLCFK